MLIILLRLLDDRVAAHAGRALLSAPKRLLRPILPDVHCLPPVLGALQSTPRLPLHRDASAVALPKVVKPVAHAAIPPVSRSASLAALSLPSKSRTAPARS